MVTWIFSLYITWISLRKIGIFSEVKEKRKENGKQIYEKKTFISEEIGRKCRAKNYILESENKRGINQSKSKYYFR